MQFNNLQLILQFLLELSGGRKGGTILLMIFIIFETILFGILSLTAKILAVIQVYRSSKPAMEFVKLRTRLLNRFSDLARSAYAKGDYETAILTLKTAADYTIGYNALTNEEIEAMINGEPIFSRDSESVSGESGQDTGGSSDSNEKSYAEIED